MKKVKGSQKNTTSRQAADKHLKSKNTVTQVSSRIEQLKHKVLMQEETIARLTEELKLERGLNHELQHKVIDKFSEDGEYYFPRACAFLCRHSYMFETLQLTPRLDPWKI